MTRLLPILVLSAVACGGSIDATPHAGQSAAGATQTTEPTDHPGGAGGAEPSCEPSELATLGTLDVRQYGFDMDQWLKQYGPVFHGSAGLGVYWILQASDGVYRLDCLDGECTARLIRGDCYQIPHGAGGAGVS